MPIKASADKLKSELAEFGFPPLFPDAPHFGRACRTYEQLEERQFLFKEAGRVLTAEFNAQLSKVQQSAAAGGAKKAKGTQKAKVAQKTGGAKRQYDILLASGVPMEQIPAFVDSKHWLKYFPPYCMDDLKMMGAAIDWRRSFITTDANPYYDAFIQWQFRTLEREGKLKFGKRHSIFSPKDGQSCADHDRASGEGVGPQEYTVVKLRVLEPLPKALAKLKGRRVFLAPATLRPETMYGQTSCFVLPTGDYGAFAVGGGADADVFVMSERAARNMAWQGLAASEGKVECLARFKGSELIGAALKAPLTAYEKIYTLPMLSIKMGKGTGVVTSVPSDSPADYATMMDMRKKEAFRKKYGVTDEMVLPFEPVPIINTSEFGDLSAKTACEQFKIASQNDSEKLEAAKDKVYNAGFYTGVFLVGEFKGQKVADVKDKIRAQLIAAGDAVVYWEPMSRVVSRSGDECVVALTDQWFVDYALPEWKARVRAYVENELETYNDELRELLLQNVDRMHEWGCSRSFGLGTKLPADPQYVIESLSDSTIYMAYYTIAHLLQGGNISPERVVTGDAGVKPEQLCDALFDYVFRGIGASDCVDGVPAAKLEQMRREFSHWYPWNLRTSGRDLAYNHLVFSLFHHAALFAPEQWPRSIKCCAFLEIDGEKMSKSKGNFLTLQDAIERFSCDGMRLTLADSGDMISVANFDVSVANASILRLYSMIETLTELQAAPDNAAERATRSKHALWDEAAFEQQQLDIVSECKLFYDRMQYREVLRRAFYEYNAMRERYVIACKARKLEPLRDTLLLSYERQLIVLCPIIPHVAEHAWGELLRRDGLVVQQRFPAVDETAIDRNVLLAADHITAQAPKMRKLLEQTWARRKKFANKHKNKQGGADALAAATKMPALTVRVSRSYAPWQQRVMDLVRDLYDDKTRKFAKEAVGVLQADAELRQLIADAFPPPPEQAAPAAAADDGGGKKKKQKKKKQKAHALIFFGLLRQIAEETGATALDKELPFDEAEAFERSIPTICALYGFEKVSVEEVTEGAMPGQPAFFFEFDDE